MGILLILFIKKVITSRKCNLELSQIVGYARKKSAKMQMCTIARGKEFCLVVPLHKVQQTKYHDYD